MLWSFCRLGIAAVHQQDPGCGRADAVEKGEQEAAERAAEELAALDTGVADDEPVLDDDDGPAATVHQNSDTGAVELDIDISVLDRPRPPAIVTRLLGNNWRVRSAAFAGECDVLTSAIKDFVSSPDFPIDKLEACWLATGCHKANRSCCGAWADGHELCWCRRP